MQRIATRYPSEKNELREAMAKRPSKRQPDEQVPSKQAIVNVPELLEKKFGPNWIMDSMSPEFRATISAFAAPGAPADKLPLAAGQTLSERLRRRSALGKHVEEDHPNLREEEENAPTLWAKYRETQAKWREELEANIAACRRAFEEGNLGALMDVLVHCTHRDGCLFGILNEHPDHWVSLPRWAVDALTVLAGETIPQVQAQKRG